MKPWAEMTARERDALVAEHVMGWRWVKVTPDKAFYGDDAIKLGGFWLDGTCSVNTTRADGTPNCPHYSTNIAAAWEVVERMGSLGWVVEVRVFPEGSPQGPKRLATAWKEEICFGELERSEGIQVVGITVPEAICFVALKATGLEI